MPSESWERNSVALPSTSPREEAHRPRLVALVLFALCAIVLQACLPLYFNFLSILDFPLLAVIYFGLAFRNPVGALVTGAVIGVAKDTFSRDFLGVFGIADTIAGYVTSVMSDRMDTENPGMRLLLVFSLYWLQFACIYLLDSILLEKLIDASLGRNALAALVNAFAGMIIFQLLDRFKTSS